MSSKEYPEVVPWPGAEAERRRKRGQPRLLVVAEGVPPPIDGADLLEDWVRAPVDPAEVAVRVELLRRRAARRDAERRVTLDEFGVLRRGPDLWVALSPTEERLMATLLSSMGSPVARAVLEKETADLDSALKRLRKRVHGLGLRISWMHGGRFVLDLDG
jgi:DNA-binding response OmpR family regulator